MSAVMDARVQRRMALKRANHVRSTRARLKRDLKAGRVYADELLQDPPEWLLSMRILELLLAVPALGRVKASRMLTRAALSPNAEVRRLSARQRVELVAAIRGRRP